jgi:predicted enzyme related to lactoylglutathione lyase
MPFKMSGNLLLAHPDAKEAAEFYKDVFGLDVFEETEDETGFNAGDNVLYLANEPEPGFVYEYYVPDLEAARDELEAKGCQVVVWEGKGRSCYMRDPFGFVFNLWEAPEEFHD